MGACDCGVAEEVLREEGEQRRALLGDGDDAVASDGAGALTADEGGEEVVGRAALVGRIGGAAENVDAFAPGRLVTPLTDAEVAR